MIISEVSFLRMVFGVYYLIAVVFDLIVIVFVILEGGIACQNASIDSETAGLEGAEAMLMAP